MLTLKASFKILGMTGTANNNVIFDTTTNTTIKLENITWGKLSRRNMFIDVIIPFFNKQTTVLKSTHFSHLINNNKYYTNKCSIGEFNYIPK